jgi:hypothetical protein
MRHETDLGSDILEAFLPQIFVQHGLLVPAGIQMSSKHIRQSDIGPVRPSVIAGVPAYMTHQKIEQPVVIVVEEHCPEECATSSTPACREMSLK